nr:unnamed protein product [Callosobruchus analis]
MRSELVKAQDDLAFKNIQTALQHKRLPLAGEVRVTSLPIVDRRVASWARGSNFSELYEVYRLTTARELSRCYDVISFLDATRCRMKVKEGHVTNTLRVSGLSAIIGQRHYVCQECQYIHGGCAIYAKCNSKAKGIPFIAQQSEEKHIEACGLTLQSEAQQDEINIICVYRPPSGEISIFLNNLTNILISLLTKKTKIILCGDLNIDSMKPSNLKIGISTLAMFLELSRSYDFLHRNFLLQKLLLYGIGGESFNWISTYSDRQQKADICKREKTFSSCIVIYSKQVFVMQLSDVVRFI